MKRSKFLKGFTLIELTVSLVILSMIGIFLLTSSLEINKSRSVLLLDIDSATGLIRNMQNRTTSFIQSDKVSNIGHGVLFDLNNSFKIETFYKIYEDGFYISEIISQDKPESDLILSSGNHIKKICVNDCEETVSRAVVYFLKPRPFAKFAIYDGVSYVDTTQEGNSISKICIEIVTPPKGKRGSESRIIEIFNIGQISFSGGYCH